MSYLLATMGISLITMGHIPSNLVISLATMAHTYVYPLMFKVSPHPLMFKVSPYPVSLGV